MDDDSVDDVYKAPTTTAQIATMLVVLFVAVMILSVITFSANAGGFIGQFVKNSTLVPIIQGATVGVFSAVFVGGYVLSM